MEQTIVIRPMTRSELDLTLDWATKEGWNPGFNDAAAFWAADPDGFVVAEQQGEILGTGAIVAYGQAFGFMGLFIVREDLRGKGIGRKLWLQRRDLLKARLAANACIGMDGVVGMQPFYAKGGFKFSHTQTRQQGVIKAPPPKSVKVVALTSLPFQAVTKFDETHFGFKRQAFLKHWLNPTQGAAQALLNEDDSIAAMGVIRAGRSDGYKIGPLFATSYEAADTLLRSLAQEARGETIFLDTPANNELAIKLARHYELTEQFSCGRMYLGSPPVLPWQQIYGVTSFELG